MDRSIEWTAVALVMSVVVEAGCSSKDMTGTEVTNAAVSSIVLTPSSTVLGPGFSQQISATLHDAVGHLVVGRQIQWASRDAQVASVDNSGLILAVGPGRTFVTAAIDGKSAAVAVSVGAPQTTYAFGRELIMERTQGSEVVRLGVDSIWGGLIVEGSLNGVDPMDKHDPGRGVGTSFYDQNAMYDGCSGCRGVWGWSTVQGGDIYNHGSPLLVKTLTPSSIYLKTQPLQWYPNDKGGGPSQAVLGDMFVEETVTPVAQDVHAFQVHYKVTHFGLDDHGTSYPEFPCLYVIKGFDRFVYYGGSQPWTNDAVSIPVVPTTSSPQVYAPERWLAYVNSANVGVTIWTPDSYPMVIMHDFGTTNYGVPGSQVLSLGPSRVAEWNFFVYVGDYRNARQLFGGLRSSVPVADPLSPLGSLDVPAVGATVGGTAGVRGWALDNVAVAKVEILVDGQVVGTAALNSIARPDVQTAYPWAPLNSGYGYSLATGSFANGTHTLTAKIYDTNGNVGARSNTITIQN